MHGFGRIGHSLMKMALKNNLFFPVSISDIKDVDTLAALLEVDSNYGRWPVEVTTKDSCFVVGRSSRTKSALVPTLAWDTANTLAQGYQLVCGQTFVDLMETVRPENFQIE